MSPHDWYRKRGRPLAFDRDTYHRRNVIERCIGWLKPARRIATRYEKTAARYGASDFRKLDEFAREEVESRLERRDGWRPEMFALAEMKRTFDV